MTRITLETRDGKYVIERDRDDYSLSDLMDWLVVPVLLAAGYHEQTIKEALAE